MILYRHKLLLTNKKFLISERRIICLDGKEERKNEENKKNMNVNLKSRKKEKKN